MTKVLQYWKFVWKNMMLQPEEPNVTAILLWQWPNCMFLPNVLYNKLPNYLKNLENLKLFKKQLTAFLLQQTYYSVDEYVSYRKCDIGK
jgi:hypothetical protein